MRAMGRPDMDWMVQMDVFTRWSQKILEGPNLNRSQAGSVGEQSRLLLQQHLDLWWHQSQALPDFPFTYSAKEQSLNEKKLEAWTSGLIHELKRLPADTQDRAQWEARLRPGLNEFARTALNFEQRHIEFIESTGMVEASQTFARMARAFDPCIAAEDIYQAGRNIMTMNMLQVLLGLPVEVTPAIFAYSMLYPYTDNYLDDPNVPGTTKVAFNHRFNLRLRGEAVRPANAHEETLHRLVAMIETQWERSRYPLVYESLLEIQAAQARSLNLVAPGAAPYELDVLGISFEKGGVSVLADGYLVAGWLTPEQAAFTYGYGAYTQLMDDMEDIHEDLKAGRQSVFTQTAGRWPLDNLTTRMIHFGRAVFGDFSAFDAPAVASMRELTDRGIDSVLIDIIGRNGKYYSKPYLRALERHVPFRFASTARQRKKFERQKLNLGKLVEFAL